MFHSIANFETVWNEEREATLRIFRLLQDKSFHQKPHNDVRDPATLASHITHTIGEMLLRTGIEVEGYEEDGGDAWTVAELCTAYEKQSAAALLQIKQHWTDASLAEMHDMYGEQWSKARVLQVLVLHQVHHRGQLTVVMRLLGMPVTGIFGPTREEWVQMGLPAMN
ncbi:MAG: DinB family protein [Bacteroidia bacterium]|nr:DinB family protein [Bacteroidia bacterium]